MADSRFSKMRPINGGDAVYSGAPFALPDLAKPS